MYTVVRNLGGHADAPTEVWLCQHRLTGELIVTKGFSRRAKPHLAAYDVDAFQRECAVARLLMTHPHPHVAQFLDVSQEGFAMPYYVGGDLFSLLEAQPGGRFDEATALRHFRGVLDGACHLQALGIAHRDISIENVLLDAQGQVKLCDFGLSTDATSVCVESVGKPQYMAPEVVAQEPYDPTRADTWSLGIVLFVLLTGSPLFALATPSDPAWRSVQRVGVAGILASWKVLVSHRTTEPLDAMLRVDPVKRVATPQHIRGMLLAPDTLA